MLNFPLDHKTSERRDHDGDMGTAAKQDLEKLNLIVTYLGNSCKAGKNYDFMIHV